MIERPEPTSEVTTMQHPTIHDAIARDHVETLRREARRARLAKARRRFLRNTRSR